MIHKMSVIRYSIPTQLKRGAKVEMEHHLGQRMAKKIARDHLKEDKNYYIKLKKAGL